MPTPPLPTKTYTALILGDDKTDGNGIDVSFDPEPIFGKKRVPVVVTVRGKKGDYTFRSTIAHMGAGDARTDGKSFTWVPFRKSHRQATGVSAGDKVKVTLTLDTKERTVEIPNDLKGALKSAAMLETFEAMSFTHRREYVEAVENAKKPETRNRRIEKCIETMHERAAENERKAKAKAKKQKAKKATD